MLETVCVAVPGALRRILCDVLGLTTIWFDNWSKTQKHNRRFHQVGDVAVALVERKVFFHLAAVGLLGSL